MIYFFKELIRGVGYWQFENSEESINAELFSEKSITEEQKIDFIRFLPREILQEIFSYLNLATLGTVCLVNKQWKCIASEPNLWKKAIYKEIAFGNDKWAKYFGKDVVNDEDNREEFSSLPLNEYIEDCKKFKSIFPEKNAKDILLLVRLPNTLNGGLTLKSLVELAKKYFSYSDLIYSYISPDVENSIGKKTISKSLWVIMTKELLPKSRNKSFGSQLDVIANLAQKDLIGYEIPETLEVATCILSQYFHPKRFVSHACGTVYYTCCKEEIQGYRVRVNSFPPDILRVSIYYSYIGSDNTGLAPLRKF